MQVTGTQETIKKYLMVVVNGGVVDGMSVCECVIMFRIDWIEQYLCRLCCCWQAKIEMVVGITKCCSPRAHKNGRLE